MRHIIPISGKDSLATAIVQIERAPALDYEFMFNPTGAELPEVFVWIEKIEEYLNQPIIRVGKNLDEIIEDYGYFLPSRLKRYCTKEAKIIPMEKFIGKDPATVYYGIRADERRIGYQSVRGNITPVYPLQEMGIDLAGVYTVINSVGLKPPTFFWKTLYDQVLTQMGGLIPELPEWVYDTLFSWRTRANCSYCFNQRKYEFVGLLEMHPDLFWKAEAMEHMGTGDPYYWREEPLTSIAKRATQIRNKRARHVCKVLTKAAQISLPLFDDEEFIDTLMTSSCGLFCGK